MYRRVVRPVLYRLGKGDAEIAHEQTLHGLRRLSRVPGAVSALSRSYGALPAGLATTVFGVRFPSPVGLAAGMDKNGVALPAWRALGFGFVEVGTVTAHPQPGNPRPRLFRLVESEGVINRMGFNNLGSAAAPCRRRSTDPSRSEAPSCPTGNRAGCCAAVPTSARAETRRDHAVPRRTGRSARCP